MERINGQQVCSIGQNSRGRARRPTELCTNNKANKRAVKLPQSEPEAFSQTQSVSAFPFLCRKANLDMDHWTSYADS